ncbi:MAG: TldD/PmbA family protein [Candidatus Hydrogenedentota bacterium]|jgi:TldD protein|uniref:TldD family protein, Actinobacterial subgroup n=1 Tax=Sumerlaea chitinivorans TaxID=2250252 RepID=A0A2Z4Y3N6_SUMC1|nr:TldD family protein, Actinobacterial subgroup [Candidatus Sumerlaea chitinivorans]RMH28062.1 MAG: TldD/PmbA family protein [Candidatus Hydrogenedentota bacterium]GIX45234.1 MAG: peptidase C69 [Candidatus Sumerlaea sp.]
MKSIATVILNRIPKRDVQYADVRVVHRSTETLSVRNGEPERILASESLGFGVRVLRSGCWGFAASCELTSDSIDRTVQQAIMTADTSAIVRSAGERFDSPAPATGQYRAACLKDPFRVPLSERLTLLIQCTQLMREEKRVQSAVATMELMRENKVFVSTLDSEIEQETVQCGAGIAAYATDGKELQVRSYPASFGGNYRAAGYEFIEELDLQGNAQRVAAEAVELLSVPECPAGEFDVILDSNQLALQIHESIGHALELDRILGYEASFAGTSFVTPEMLGSFKYGSPAVSVVADATVAGGLGSFAFDDEGTPARCEPLITEGILRGVLSSCSTAPLIGRRSSGAMRADGWQNFPIVRMTNINLLPGEWTLEELIADTKRGLFFETNRSWSIDDRRLQFQFATEVAREIRNGKLGRLFRNPIYGGVTPQFWRSCDAVCRSSDWVLWGVPNCGKGEPMQIARVGHGCAPARFRNVTVGRKA